MLNVSRTSAKNNNLNQWLASFHGLRPFPEALSIRGPLLINKISSFVFNVFQSLNLFACLIAQAKQKQY